MKAVVFTTYGPPEVLQLKEVEKPALKDNEILIRIRANAVNSGDWRIRKPDPFAVRFFFGLMKPKKQILGTVFSGEVERTGSRVLRFKVGDEVFGSAGTSFGTYAEYKSLAEDAAVALKPKNLTHEEAAVIPFGGVVALYFLRKANIQPGQKVLVYGASGAVGTAAIQLAKYFGADVTGVCSTANTDMVRSLGADRVIDYTKEDVTRNGQTYDIIFETVNKISVPRAVRSLNKHGVLLLGAAGAPEMLQALWASATTGKKVFMGVISEKSSDMTFLKDVIEQGKMKPVIDRTYRLEQIAEAHHYVERGHKKGNVAITLSGM